MKKVAFTLGLAFFAIGLFAQNASNTSATAKPVPTSTVASRKEPLKPTSMQTAQAKNQSAAATPAHSASTAKAAPMSNTNNGDKTKPATKPAAKQTAGETAKGTPTKKHRARHHKKPASTTAPETGKTAPKKN